MKKTEPTTRLACFDYCRHTPPEDISSEVEGVIEKITEELYENLPKLVSFEAGVLKFRVDILYNDERAN